MHFCDSVKKNAHKLIARAVDKQEIVKVLCKKIKKRVIQIRSMENKKVTSNLKVKEYTCYMIKTLEEVVRKGKEIVVSNKNEVFETICLGAECDDIMIRNQSQQLFTYILKLILSNSIPLREELEILLVKVVLKPALLLVRKD